MATQPSDSTEFPIEIVVKPLALIGVSGLDTTNNAVHKTIWDAFSNNRRTDRAAVSFKLITNTFEFPVIKPKRNSYEWYIPKGILKKNWIKKRISLIPAVVVIFYDLEWDDLQWNEKVIECASRVQSIRAAVDGHTTRIAVVVVQSQLSSPPSEYIQGAEKAQALCAACEIQSKSLFILPHSDHLIGYIARLEAAFYDIAQNYYHHECKNIKQHREHLNKTTHHYLFVRHQFKLGYLNELKQDHSTAHKHYMQAYNNLLETRIVDTNIHEVRTVAGYINYKLCRLLFALNLPRDAISQLKSHVERYKSRVGTTELLFEHYAWIARQYSAFGELFDEAIRDGLPAIQSQHPGFYYQQAAQFTGKRRQAMRSVCSEVLEYPPPPDPLDGVVEYYGQRPWRPGRLSADPHDPQKELIAIQALQFKERIFNHSAVIIGFLGCAITQFKTFYSPRMRKQLVVEMANEYYYCGDFSKALTLLTHMLWDYRKEKWWYLASYVLDRALQCAFLSAKVQDYLQLSLEALTKNIQVPNNDKDRIFNNIMAVLNLEVPAPEPDLSAASQNNALELWKKAVESDPFVVSVDIVNMSGFLEAKPKFKYPKYKMDEIVEIELYIRLSFANSLEISKLILFLACHNDIVEIPIDDNSSPIIMEAGKVRLFTCNYKCKPQDVKSELHITKLSVILGAEKRRKLIINYKFEDNKTQELVFPELLHFVTSPRAKYDFDCVVPSTRTSITPRDSHLTIDIVNFSPALQGEWFPTNFKIKNSEETSIFNVNILISVLNTPENPNLDSAIEIGLCVGEPRPLPLKLSVTSIEKDSTHSGKFYFKSSKVTSVAIQLRITYLIDLPEMPKLECSKDHLIKINVAKPFEVSSNFVGLKFQPINKCFVDDSFIVMPQIKILSPWDLVILETELDLQDCFKFTNKSTLCIKDLEVSEGNVACDAVCVQAKSKPKEAVTRVGLYNIKWRRKNVDGQFIMSSTSLSALPIEPSPISLQINIPEIVELQTSTSLSCTIIGKLVTPVRLSIMMESSDSYMFSGYRKLEVVVPPNEKVVLSYNIHPLVAGCTTPPRLKATVIGDSTLQSAVSEIFDRSFPRNIFVMPKYNK